MRGRIIDLKHNISRLGRSKDQTLWHMRYLPWFSVKNNNDNDNYYYYNDNNNYNHNNNNNNKKGNNIDDNMLLTKLINMAKRAEGLYDNTSPKTISMSMRNSLHFTLAATLWVIPLLLLLGTLIAILKCMYKRKKYERSKNKGQSKALKYRPYWTRIHVTNSLFLPWFSGSFTIEIFNQRDVSSIKTDTFHS